MCVVNVFGLAALLGLWRGYRAHIERLRFMTLRTLPVWVPMRDPL